MADRIAEKYGYRNMGQVCVLLLIDPVKVASNLCLSVFSSTLKIGLNMPLPRRQSCAIKPQSLKSKPEPTRVLLTLKQTREGEALRNKESRPAAGWHNRCLFTVFPLKSHVLGRFATPVTASGAVWFMSLEVTSLSLSLSLCKISLKSPWCVSQTPFYIVVNGAAQAVFVLSFSL